MALVFLCLLAGAGPARAQTHLFDATLSLEGDCVPSTLDEVPDPGCPYPEAGGPQRFAEPKRSASGAGGEIYVLHGAFADERIEVFDASGHWVFAAAKEALVEPVEAEFGGIVEPGASSIRDIAVDSQGYLYVVAIGVAPSGTLFALVVRYTPSTAAPEAGTSFGEPHVVAKGNGVELSSLALDEDDRLYVVFAKKVDRYKSAEDENELQKAGFGGGVLANPVNVAVGSGPEHDLYVSDEDPTVTGTFKSRIRIFDGQTGTLQETIDGSDTPNCEVIEGKEECGFSTFVGHIDPAVDRVSEELFVADPSSKTIYAFRRGEGAGAPYEYVESIQHGFTNNFLGLRVEYDNGPASPNRGYLFATSHTQGQGHLYAFAPKPIPDAPVIEGQRATGITTSEARLRATVNPRGAETRWHFEYVAEETFEADIEALGAGHGFDKAVAAPVPDATLPAGTDAVPVSVAVAGLSPDTIYRFRAVAENCTEEPAGPCETLGEGEPGTEGKSARFGTYPAPAAFGPCPNEALRVGPSAALPDCRAYELVTPPETNGLAPVAYSIGSIAPAWGGPLVSPGGESVLFATEGGSLPGYEGTGTLNADGYRARRDPAAGWATEAAGPSGVQSQAPNPGGHSADHSCWVWQTFVNDEATLGPNATYVRHADHSFELVGLGALGGDPQAVPRFISEDCAEIFFTSKAHLEESAPPAGTVAIYERPRGGPAEIVSLLPGEVIPAAGQDAAWLGASADGSAAAFELGGTLYLRRGGQTLQVSDEEALFAGLSADGRHLFYLHPNSAAPVFEGTEIAQGELFSYDAQTQAATQIGSGKETVPANVAATGAAAYFVSPKQLLPGMGEPGQPNLYGWYRHDGAIRFVATLDPIDVSGAPHGEEGTTGGLGLWVSHVVASELDQRFGPLSDPSRTTPEGEVLLFESSADLSAHGSDGEREVYRFAAASQDLACLSCDPTLAPAAGAQLVHLFSEGSADEGKGRLRPLAATPNLSADGQRALFETGAALVPGDVNGAIDVYEWRAPGVYGCERQGGCLALISSGQSAFASHLWGASADGADVLVRTTERLLGADFDSSPSIYDARIGGGFPEAALSPCEGEACKAAPPPPPSLGGAGSASFAGPGNVAANPCASEARKAKKLSAAAKRLRVASRRDRRLRDRAARLTRQAKLASQAARKCRRQASRRAR